MLKYCIFRSNDWLSLNICDWVFSITNRLHRQQFMIFVIRELNCEASVKPDQPRNSGKAAKLLIVWREKKTY